LVEALRYKPKGHRFNSQSCHYNFFIDITLSVAIGPGVDPASRTDNLTTFLRRLSKNLGASTSWNPKGLTRPVMGLLYLYLTIFMETKEVINAMPGQRYGVRRGAVIDDYEGMVE
jgi:hypothetical protein